MKILILLFVLFSAVQAQQDIENNESIPLTHVFKDFGSHFIQSFTYNYGLNHIIAASGSYGIVKSNTDWEIFKFMNEHEAIGYAGFSGVIVGGLTPLVLPLGLYYYGKANSNNELQNTALALGQAAIISYFISSGYKAITARRGPDVFDNENKTNYSEDFKFGLFNRGVFDGWPSGHTTTAFAMAFTLRELYPENETIQIGSLIYAVFIGLSVSTNIHWFSDAFAGAFIGYAIGKTVGNGFKNIQSVKIKEQGLNYNFLPNGIMLTYRF